MENYTVEDTKTGKQITFEWYVKSKPTQADMQEVFSAAGDQVGSNPSTPSMASGMSFPKPEEKPGWDAYMNRGIATGLGLPVDMLTAVLNKIPGVDIKKPVGGSENLKTLMGYTGDRLTNKPAETTIENIAEVGGEALGSALPLSKLVSLVSKTYGVSSAVAKSIAQTFKENPTLFLSSEVGSVVGAGTGRRVAQDIENPAGKIAAELVGGVAGGLGPQLYTSFSPTARLIGNAGTIRSKLSAPFTKEGSKERAGRYIKGLVSDPDETLKKLETPSSLHPVVQSEEKRFAQLQKALTNKSAEHEKQIVDSLGNSEQALRSELKEILTGNSEDLTKLTKGRVQNIETKLQKKIDDALSSSRKAIDSLPVSSRKSEESRIVRNVIESEFSKAKDENRKIWKLVNKGAEAGTSNLRSTYQKIINDLSDAEISDIPAKLRNSKLLEFEVTDVRQLQGLRSKLLEVERKAVKAGDSNKARISGIMADAILEDLSLSGSEDSLKAAIKNTRELKTKFKTGKVGKILGYGKDYQPAIAPEMTLDASVGKGSIKGSVDIEKVAMTPEAMAATERYVTSGFADYAIKDGKLNQTKAASWISDNKDVIDKIPGLESKLTKAISSDSAAQEMISKTTKRIEALKNPDISYSAKYLKSADIGTEVDAMIKDAGLAEQMVKQASKDPKALNGIRAEFLNNMTKKSSIGAYNDAGEKTLSGKAMLGFIKENEASVSKVFTPEQIDRIKKVATELTKLEKYKGATGKIDIELDDAASHLLNLSSMVGGAMFGGHLARHTAGGSFQVARIASTRAQKLMSWLTKNRAEELVKDAILNEDPTLLKALLKPIGKPGTKDFDLSMKFLETNLNAWLAGTGNRVYEEIKKENGD